MDASLHHPWNRRKRRIVRRIKNKPGVERRQPMTTASNIRCESAEKVRAGAPGDAEAMHLQAGGRRLEQNERYTVC